MPAPQLSKADRQALLAQLAAKRQQPGAGGAYRDLEDSEDDSAASPPASYAAARPRPPTTTLLDDSDSEGENQRPLARPAAPAGSTAAGRLNRLRKAADLALPAPSQQPQQQPQQQQQQQQRGSQYDRGDEDIAAALESLTIRKAPKPSGGGARRGAGAGSSRPPASRSRQASPPSDDEAEQPAAAAAADGSQCMVLGDSGEFKLNAKASTMLYPHQVEGLRWLWSLFRLRRGGILADDMGLGKTIQCAAFLAGLIESRLIQRAIVVAPKTLLAQWRKELEVCGLGSAAHEYGGSAGEREAALAQVVRRRGVLLTTYGMVQHNAEALAQHRRHDPDEGPLWDIMICDEGHKLKNPRMQLRQKLDALPCGLRVIISGTPIQNNLLEMWALFNFACPDLLGDAPDFRDRYERAITVGADKHATVHERERGAVAAARLRQEIAPYLLRREKRDVFKAAGDDAGASQAGPAAEGQGDGGAAAVAGAAGEAAGGGCRPAAMPHKNDLIVWLRLQPMQKRVYQAFLNSDSVKQVFNQTSSALAAITVLKKVCDHPALLSERAARGIISGASRARRQAAARLGGAGSDADAIEGSSDEELLDSEEGEWESGSDEYSSDEERRAARRRRATATAARNAAAKAAAPPPAAVAEEEWDVWASADLEQKLLDEVHTTGFEASCKTVFVMGLLHQLVAEGHRTLIFSQSRVMLNILEAAIKEERWRYCRIDGSVASAAEREARVRQFQTTPSIPLFLLTSQVGGLGLTLTGADRVVILDPAWNPSTDNQSVDRAYRIGQKRDVVVYRLISCGTVEEKIYRRQVFKGGLMRTGMEEGEQWRYFAQEDLRDLFRLDPAETQASATQRELHAMHAAQRKQSPELAAHLAFLATLDCYAGVSDHDLLFSKKEKEAPELPASAAAGTSARAPPGAAASGGWGAGASTAGGGRGGSVGAAGAGASPRKGLFSKTATQGWSGGGDLSDLFAKGLSISSGAGAASAGAAAVAAAAQPPGASWGKPSGSSSGAGAVPPAALPAPPAHRLSGGVPSPKEPLQERVAELEEVLQRKRHLLGLSAGLADGGARVRSQIAELEQELAAAKREAAGGGAPTPAAAAPAAPAPSLPAAALVPAVAAAPAVSAKPQPDSRILTAAAAAPLTSGFGAGGSQPAVPPVRPAAPPAPTALAAPSAAPPAAQPAASPLLTRMRDILSIFGSGKKAAPPADPAAAPPSSSDAGGLGGISRLLTFGAPKAPPGGASTSSTSAVIDLSGDDGPGPSSAATAAGAGAGAFAAPLPRAPEPQARQQPLQPQQQQQQQPSPAGGALAPAAAKPPRSKREVKHRLMETLRAIKEAEAGGYYDRTAVDKLRRRASRLAGEYEGLKAAEAGAALA